MHCADSSLCPQRVSPRYFTRNAHAVSMQRRPSFGDAGRPVSHIRLSSSVPISFPHVYDRNCLVRILLNALESISLRKRAHRLAFSNMPSPSPLTSRKLDLVYLIFFTTHIPVVLRQSPPLSTTSSHHPSPLTSSHHSHRQHSPLPQTLYPHHLHPPPLLLHHHLPRPLLHPPTRLLHALHHPRTHLSCTN